MADSNARDLYWNMPSNKDKALMLAKKQLPDFVCDAINLEGINITVPEVQTLLEGITIGGHKIEDQQITLNQAYAWDKIFKWVKNDTFKLNKENILELHKISAKEEALEWGSFRSGSVTISGTDYMPPEAEKLPGLFEQMVTDSYSYKDVYDRAFFIFLTMARNQFFYDVNKRMGRFAMNGLLLQEGFPAINVPAKRKLEFNQLMIEFYELGDLGPMNKFLRSCLDSRIIEIMLQ